MRAINELDFEKYGCVNCGCDYAYVGGMAGSVNEVVCAECGERFLIISSLEKVSQVGFGVRDYQGFTIPKNICDTLQFFSTIDFGNKEVQNRLAYGIAVEEKGFVYPVVRPHPREGILKHELIIPDIRPEMGQGDYCYPRGVGYDLACFVKSKEAGIRITEMINRVEKDYEKDSFHCHLDYRPSEPLWIQVKIAYTNELRAAYLSELIEENDFIITEELVRLALNKNLDEIMSLWEEDIEERKSR